MEQYYHKKNKNLKNARKIARNLLHNGHIKEDYILAELNILRPIHPLVIMLETDRNSIYYYKNETNVHLYSCYYCRIPLYYYLASEKGSADILIEAYCLNMTYYRDVCPECLQYDIDVGITYKNIFESTFTEFEPID
jgi:hypothetical protein